MPGLYLPDLKTIVRAACTRINANSDEAVALVLGTALVESGASYLFQGGRGPALGLFQMEPATHDDCWQNFINNHPALSKAMTALAGNSGPVSLRCAYDVLYAAAMCRVRYLRCADKLPTDAEGMCAYWKGNYNTALGAGTVDFARIALFQQAMACPETPMAQGKALV